MILAVPALLLVGLVGVVLVAGGDVVVPVFVGALSVMALTLLALDGRSQGGGFRLPRHR